MLRSILMSCVLAPALAGVSCGGAQALKLRPNDAIIPVVNGADPGQAIGRCVRFAEGGPVTVPCPPGVDRFFSKPQLHEMSKPGSYAYGTFTRGGGVDRAHETVVGYEFLTYTSRSVRWKTKLKPKELPALRALCGSSRWQHELVITRSFEGCGITLSGNRQEAWQWTVATLGSEGAVIGQPEKFWSQAPGGGQPAGKAKCKARRVVQVEVLPVARACARYHTDLFPAGGGSGDGRTAKH